MKQCPSFPGYSVNSQGEVFSHRRRGRLGPGQKRIDPDVCRKASIRISCKGYRVTAVVVGGINRVVGVHQLVADAYHGPCPEGEQVRHINGIGADNRPSNLRYGTIFENAQDRVGHGGYLSGSDHCNAKLKPGQAAEIRERRSRGEKVKDLAAAYGIGVSTVEDVIYGRSYTNDRATVKRIDQEAKSA